MKSGGYRQVSLAVLNRCVRAGFRWSTDGRDGPGGRFLISPRGQVFRFASRPLALCRYEPHPQFADEA